MIMRSVLRILLFSQFVIALLPAQTNDRWSLSVGSMFVVDFETEMQISRKDVPLGARINTKDQLGLDHESAVFRADGLYRFNDAHSLGVSYYAAKSTGSRYVETEFEWDGDVLENVQTNTYFNMYILELVYGYSFYHSDDIELELIAGLHVTAIDLGFKATGVVNGMPDQFISTAESVTAPLPVFGFKGEYTIIPNHLFVSYKAEYLYLMFENNKGQYISNMLSLEYRFTEHFGIGTGFNANFVKVEMVSGDKKIDVVNQLNGVMLFLTYAY